MRGARIIQRDEHVISGRQKPACNAACHHFAVAQQRRGAGNRLSCRCDEVVRGRYVINNIRHAAGMDQAHGDIAERSVKSGQVDRLADNGEGSGVNLRRVFQIAPHNRPSSTGLAGQLAVPRRFRTKRVIGMRI